MPPPLASVLRGHSFGLIDPEESFLAAVGTPPHWPLSPYISLQWAVVIPSIFLFKEEPKRCNPTPKRSGSAKMRPWKLLPHNALPLFHNHIPHSRHHQPQNLALVARITGTSVQSRCPPPHKARSRPLLFSSTAALSENSTRKRPRPTWTNPSPRPILSVPTSPALPLLPLRRCVPANAATPSR